MLGDIRVRFGQRLRKLRLERSLTQVEFAEKLGIDRSYLTDIERGNRNVSLINIDILAKGLGLSLAQLFKNL